MECFDVIVLVDEVEVEVVFVLVGEVEYCC